MADGARRHPALARDPGGDPFLLRFRPLGPAAMGAAQPQPERRQLSATDEAGRRAPSRLPERRLLQAVLAIGCLVPLAAGRAPGGLRARPAPGAPPPPPRPPG